MDWTEACRILGVSEVATETEIKEQYLYKAQLLHPDKNLDKPESVRTKAEAEFARVNQAYAFVSNPINNPYRVPPKLAVDPTGIRFVDVYIAERKSTVLTVRSIGGPYSSIWMDDQPAPWLTVKQVKSITSDQLPLEVTLECRGMGEPGKHYICSLLIKLENEITHTLDTVNVPVEMIVLPREAQNNAVPAPAPAGTGNASKASATKASYAKATAAGTASSGAAAAKGATQPVNPSHAPPSPTMGRKPGMGFSVPAFLVNFIALVIFGAVVLYIVNLYVEIKNEFLVLGLIVYSGLIFGVCFDFAIRKGSGKKKSRKP